MKKLFLFLACFIINIENVRADEPLSAEVDTSQKIKLEVEKYKKECSKKAYPKNLDEINIYNDDLKKLDAKYTCEELLDILKEMNFAEIQEQGFIPLYKRERITDDLHDVCGFRTDYQFITKSKMRNIQKKSKGKE